MVELYNVLQTITHDLSSSSKNEKRLDFSTIPELLACISGHYFKGKRKLLSVFEKYSNKNNRTKLSVKSLSLLTGLSERQVIRNIKYLGSMYFNGVPILRIRRSRQIGSLKSRVNVYRLHPCFMCFDFHVGLMHLEEFSHHKKYNQAKRLNYDPSNDHNLTFKNAGQNPYVTPYNNKRELRNYNYSNTSLRNDNERLNNYNFYKRLIRKKSDGYSWHRSKLESRMDNKNISCYDLDKISVDYFESRAMEIPKRGSSGVNILRIHSLFGLERSNFPTLSSSKYPSFVELSEKLTLFLRGKCMLSQRESIVVNKTGGHAVIGPRSSLSILNRLNTTVLGSLIIISFGKRVISELNAKIKNKNIDFKPFFMLAVKEAKQQDRVKYRFFNEFIANYSEIISIMINIGAVGQPLTTDGNYKFSKKEYDINKELIGNAMSNTFQYGDAFVDKGQSRKTYREKMEKFSSELHSQGMRPFNAFVENDSFICELREKLKDLKQMLFTCSEEEFGHIDMQIKKIENTMRFTKSLVKLS